MPPTPSAPARRSLPALVLALVLALVAAGCSGDDGGSEGGLGQLLGGGSDDGSGGSSTATEPGAWTLFAYIAADNDLEPFALEDLDEMTRATGIDIVALVDRSGTYSSDDALGMGDFEDTQVFHIADGAVEVVDELGEVDTGDPATLADFVADGLSRFGAERNGLVIWNHGASWPGAAIDETSGGTLLSLAGIRDAVADGLDRAGVDKLDLIGFDACLMATYEVAQNLEPVAQTLLASEELEPGHGWDWSQVAAPGGEISTVDLATAITDGFAAQSVDYGTSGVTLSLVDLGRLDGIDSAFDAMTAAVGTDAAGLVGRIASERGDALGFGRDPDPAYDLHMVDIGHLASLLTDVDGMAAAAAELEAAVDEAVLVNVTDSTTAQARGLAVYFPPLADLGVPSYEEVADIGPWTGFLGAYYTGAEGVPSEELPAFLDEDRYIDEDEVDSSDEGISFTTEVVAGTGINIQSSKLFWGQVDLDDTNLVAFFGERLAEIDGDAIRAEYDWRYLVIEDGTTEAPAYTQLDLDEAGEIRRIVVPITYTHAEDSVRGVLVLGIDGASVVSETFYGYSDEGTVGEIQPEPGDTFVPQLLLQDLTDFSSEWQDSTSTPLSADPAALEHHLRRLAPFTPVMLELNLTDVDGGRDYVFHGTASP